MSSASTMIHLQNGMESKPILVVVVGPTAVGKTGIAIDLAERFRGEIVSADSRLFYRGMDIGTAKPTEEERARVPHHLIDVAEPGETWSLAIFQKAAIEAIADIHARGKLPFLVGGTGQYIHAVTQAWLPPGTKPDEKLRDVLEKLAAVHGRDWLHRRLALIDPPAAGAIDPKNVRRTIRAFEVIFDTGKRFSEQRRKGESPYYLINIGLTRPRPDLYARIDARIDAMFAAGLLDEVAGLLRKGYPPSLPTLSAIGYRECVAVLNGVMDIETAKARMRRLTRVFVRRQANWFKSDDPQIKWFRVDGKTGDDVEKYIRECLRS
jgi:tRNA dimethylallyltransferase